MSRLLSQKMRSLSTHPLLSVYFLYSRNTGKVWLVDSKREVIDELDLRCSNLRHMLVDNKNENILYELYQQNGSCKVYYQPIGEIDILSSYSLR